MYKYHTPSSGDTDVVYAAVLSYATPQSEEGKYANLLQLESCEWIQSTEGKLMAGGISDTA